MAQKRPDSGSIHRDVNGAYHAQVPPPQCVGYEKLTVGAAAVPFASCPATADTVLLRVETNDIRWRGDNVVPTATDGMLMKSTDAPLLLSNVGYEDLLKHKFIQATAGATLHVLYYRTRG